MKSQCFGTKQESSEIVVMDKWIWLLQFHRQRIRVYKSHCFAVIFFWMILYANIFPNQCAKQLSYNNGHPMPYNAEMDYFQMEKDFSSSQEIISPSVSHGIPFSLLLYVGHWFRIWGYSEILRCIVSFRLYWSGKVHKARIFSLMPLSYTAMHQSSEREPTNIWSTTKSELCLAQYLLLLIWYGMVHDPIRNLD